ncbi:hypothetical protein DM02DRAFT_419525 [Periconia macrospinosa]|uniref:FYVE-type domain-containing protein n=1 Tax=Periconia macrospinosa TaxID=97972 RepID=A0A2V1DR56_9PLEO|nr:hypothetical protein DM02DRAFT_419525 [Periconia macrospinosa]
MATDFSSANVAAKPTPYQHAYRKSAQYAPINFGANTPMNASPTSPRSSTIVQPPAHQTNGNGALLRPLKTPLYIPAALRRTENRRPSPPKCDTPVDGWNRQSPFASGASDVGPLARIATEDMNNIYNDGPLSPIAGPITRNHWQPDTSATECSASSCQQPFNWRNRRHHCRKCGGIFCWQHSQKVVRLNEHALFHPEGDWQRSCDRCHTQYREWEQLRSSRTNSESSGSGSTAAVGIDAPHAKRPETTRVGSLATSFGGNWNWSTF